jgi:hypothetical protein
MHVRRIYTKGHDRATTTTVGEPDFACYGGGRVAFVEFKMPGKKPREEQTRRHNELAAAGCTVRVCYDLKSAIEWIEENLDAIHRREPADCGRGELKTASPAQENNSSANGVQPDVQTGFVQKLWVTEARHVGKVVVARNPEGHIRFVRMARGDDLTLLPILPKGVEW